MSLAVCIVGHVRTFPLVADSMAKMIASLPIKNKHVYFVMSSEGAGTVNSWGQTYNDTDLDPLSNEESVR